MESTSRDLSNDMAEQMPILKNNLETYHFNIGFTLKTGIAFLKTRFCFYYEGNIVELRGKGPEATVPILIRIPFCAGCFKDVSST